MAQQLRALTRVYPWVIAVTVLYVSLFGAPAITTQAMIAALGVIALGLPHGAADMLVAREAGFFGSLGKLAGFFMVYLGLIALALAFWRAAPSLALAIFLLTSGWHFAGDWAPSLKGPYRLAVGVAILASPTVLYREEVALVFSSLVPAETATLMASLMFGLTLSLLPAAFFIPFRPDSESTKSGVPVVTTLASALLLPPLLFFVGYFCVYHSPKHLAGVVSRLTPVSRARLRVTIGLTVLAALPFMWAAHGFILMREDLAQSPWLQFTFIGLFALTVPHMVLEEVVRSQRVQHRVDHSPTLPPEASPVMPVQ